MVASVGIAQPRASCHIELASGFIEQEIFHYVHNFGGLFFLLRVGPDGHHLATHFQGPQARFGWIIGEPAICDEAWWLLLGLERLFRRSWCLLVAEFVHGV
jgi:hypothetical protein